MSNLNGIYLLSEYQIDENDREMKSIIENFHKYCDNKEYYRALYTMDSLILQDGTSQKYNYIFLKFIISNIVNLIEDINKKKMEKIEKMKKIKKKDKNLIISDYLNDVDKYDFYYLRNCFDKYEIALNDKELDEILNKKLKYNDMIIKKEDKKLKDQYAKFIKRFSFEGNFIPPKEIYETINNFNKLIKNDDYKLFYLYKYINIENIEKDYIFDYLEKDYLYLNQFYFPKFDDLGIPIGYSNNIHIIYRYLFSILQNKINILEGNKNEDENNNDKALKYVFNTFKKIFKNIQNNKVNFMKYFSFIFSNVIFDVDRNILFSCDFNEIPTYFRILVNQFLYKDEIDKSGLEKFKTKKNCNISFGDRGNATITINNEIIELNHKEYSINSFLYYYVQNSWIEHINFIKNKSQRLLCENKIYDKYFNEFINLLKKICVSNVAKTLQSLHEEFKQYKPFYENDGILEDLFNNRLKFYPFESKGLYGLTDKYLMEIYLSSIYSLNTSTSLNQYCKKHPHILIIFNMGFNSVIFQHESLNHYIRAYLFYSNDRNNNLRKISMNTKKNYYPKQKLNKIKNAPLYLKKFLVKMNSDQLKELKKVSTLNFQDLLEESSDEKKDGNDSDVEMSDDNNDVNTDYNKNESNNVYNINHGSDEDDEGYYYERQLFTYEYENKLKEFNFLQALMLLDEDAYNLDPVHFHYCFLKLKNANNYKLIKENFQSPLLKLLLEKVDFSKSDEIKKLTFISKRSGLGGLLFEFNRDVCDVMPPYIRNVNQ